MLTGRFSSAEMEDLEVIQDVVTLKKLVRRLIDTYRIPRTRLAEGR